MLPLEFLHEVDPSYLAALNEANNALKGQRDPELIMDILLNFAKSYMMPKQFWNLYLSNSFEVSGVPPNREVVAFAVYQLYYKPRLLNPDRCRPIPLPFRKLLKASKRAISHWDLKVKDNIVSTIQNLSYPNDSLRSTWTRYEKNLNVMPSMELVKKYRKMKDLYKKIMEAENNEEWFKAITSVEDYEFVEHNVEYRLGYDLSNKPLWKLYIQWIEDQKENQKLLHTYSKYCRFFLEDQIMKEKYQKAVEKFGPIEVPWKNLFDFEKKCTNSLTNLFTYKEAPTIPDSMSEPSHPAIFFNADNAQQQVFDFKSPYINYIMKNANARVLHSLFESCKFFFIKNPSPICYTLALKQRANNDAEVKFDKQSMEIINQPPLNFESIYLSTYFIVNNNEDRHAFSNFMRLVYKSDVKYLSIAAQDITFDDLKVLIGHGNAVMLELNEVNVLDNSGRNVMLEDILKLVPKAKYIDIRGIQTYADTAQKLLDQVCFENRLSSLNLSVTSLEAEAFAEFLKRNMEPLSTIFIRYKVNNNPDAIRDFKRTVDEVLKNHWNPKEKPSFKSI